MSCNDVIDFASRFPPRHLEVARLRCLEASRLSDLQILLESLLTEGGGLGGAKNGIYTSLGGGWGHFGSLWGHFWYMTVTLDHFGVILGSVWNHF